MAEQSTKLVKTRSQEIGKEYTFVLDILRRKTWKSTMDSDGFSGYMSDMPRRSQNIPFALLKDVCSVVVLESLPVIIGG